MGATSLQCHSQWVRCRAPVQAAPRWLQRALRGLSPLIGPMAQGLVMSCFLILHSMGLTRIAQARG